MIEKSSGRVTVSAALLALLAAGLWGGNTVAIKIALTGLPPLAIAALRFFVGGLVVFCWTRVIKIPVRMQASERKALAFLGILFAFQIYLLNLGVRFTLAGRSTLLMATNPFFVTLFAHFILSDDRLNRFKVLGTVLAFSGVAIIFAESFSHGQTEYLLGDLLILASAVLLGLRQVYMKKLLAGIHPAKLLFWQAALSVPLFILFSLLLERKQDFRLDWRVGGSLLYEGLIVAGFCFILWTSLLKKHSASRLGVFIFLSPLFGVMLSALILGETISPLLLVSVVLVAGGIAVVNLRG